MCVGMAATADIMFWWAKAAGAGMGQDSASRECPIAWWHKRGQAALWTGGWRSTVGSEDEPGGRLQPGCEATAGLACGAPTAELRLGR